MSNIKELKKIKYFTSSFMIYGEGTKKLSHIRAFLFSVTVVF